MNKDVAVVILNWNGVKHLEEFLPSVIQHTNSSIADIYVIDNASTDTSVTFLNEKYPSIKIVQNSSNGGFAKGYNDGLKYIQAKYYLLLNSDVEVSSHWLEPLFKKMESSPEIAACMPKILDYKNKIKFEHAGAAGGFIDKFGYPFCRGRLFNSIENDESQYNNDIEIFWATGACMMIRANLYHEQSGFDESFFAHMEEIDLCWRLKNEGFKIYFVHNSTVFHLGGGTLSSISPNKTYLNFRNNLYLLFKNLPDKFLYRTIFARMILDGLAFFHFAAIGKLKHASAVWRAHVSFYKNIKSLRLKRSQNKQYHQLKYLVGVYNDSIVYRFYLKNIKVFELLDIKKFGK
ncbi:MAG TPA: glycosyltransferase family 2 protein [Bacteroidia bacterium]|nr:glycosyltransferase family 2 protein [Bacteroidia bacterium]